MRSKLVFLGAMALTLTGAQFSAGTNMCAAASDSAAGAPAVLFKGTVVETMNASRYTYVLIDTGKEKIWAAGPEVAVKVGDSVSLGEGMANKNFYSKTLKRTFDELYFVGAITPAGGACPVGAAGASTLPPGHSALKTAGDDKTSTNTVFEVIQKPGGGRTVAEIWADKAKLSGKQVIVRAKVVKVATKIMGMNWLHLRDGTGSEGSNDLTVTTKAEVKVGQIVTASGLLSTDKDFGAGYRYDVILEGATVTVK
ncbi:MAG: DNA-binding protein [bacterium]